MRGNNGPIQGSQNNGGANPSKVTICGIPLVERHQCDPNDRGI